VQVAVKSYTGLFMIFLVAYAAKCVGKSSLLKIDQQWFYLALASYGSLQPDTNPSPQISIGFVVLKPT